MRLSLPIWFYFFFVFPPVTKIVWQPLFNPATEPGGVLADAQTKDISFALLFQLALPALCFWLLVFVLPWAWFRKSPLHAANVFMLHSVAALTCSTLLAATVEIARSKANYVVGTRKYGVLELAYQMVSQPEFWRAVIYALGIFVIALVTRALFSLAGKTFTTGSAHQPSK